MSRDCNVTIDDADNPNIKCTRKKHVKETCRFISWGGWWQHQSRMENFMSSIPAHYEGTKQSSKSRSKAKSTPADDWCCLISQNHIMPALFDHDFGGNRERGCTWCLSIWSPASVSAWTIEVYIVLTSLFHYCSVPSHFQEWLDKRSSPDVPIIELLPGSISRSCPPSNEYDSPNGVTRNFYSTLKLT